MSHSLIHNYLCIIISAPRIVTCSFAYS